MADQSKTKWFKTDKFNHIELVNQTALELLDEVRDAFGYPLIITDDARVRGEPLPPGASGNSLHFDGQAFDIRTRDWTTEKMWTFVAAGGNIAHWVARGQEAGIELEIVHSKTDKHGHVGFFLGDGRKNRFIVRAE